MQVKKAVIPAAGLGTRFLPATKAQPKEMLPLVDTPIIQYVVEEALSAGIRDILLVTGKNKRAIEDHFDRAPELENHLRQSSKDYLLELIQQEDCAFVHYVRQPEPRGLGHAVLMARHHVGREPFAVLLGDEVFVGERPCLGELVDVAARVQASVIAVVPVPPQDVSRYGVVSGEEISPGLYRVHDLVEKPPAEQAPSHLAIVGRYVLDPEVFDILERQPPGFGGEIQLTDALRELARYQPLYAYRPHATRYDVGDKLGFLKATVEFALGRADLGPAFRAFLAELVGRTPPPPRPV
ncbi:MAG: UTP--glucose-1-phosphate uridylyltransferase GalU [Bacillota bacterium]|nr:UTP--glucose-1-phosphate uridylyltransferase GalU [Bacillota bacterium]